MPATPMRRPSQNSPLASSSPPCAASSAVIASLAPAAGVGISSSGRPARPSSRANASAFMAWARSAQGLPRVPPPSRCRSATTTAARLGEPYTYHPTLIGLARWADILMVSVRADATNYRAVNKEVLAALGPRGHLVNISRGIAVDEAALCDALEAGAIAGAALDGFERGPLIPGSA